MHSNFSSVISRGVLLIIKTPSYIRKHVRAILTHTATFQVASDVRTVLCPNITGTFTARFLTATRRESDFVGDGCFYYAGASPFSGTNDAGDKSLVVGFDASGSNSIYKGNTVQSSAAQILIIIKV